MKGMVPPPTVDSDKPLHRCGSSMMMVVSPKSARHALGGSVFAIRILA